MTLALLLLLVAASHSATAQTKVVLQAGTPYTIHSAAEAVSSGREVLYKWYRDGAEIAGATGANYEVPSSLAVGVGVEFKRAAYTDGCDGYKYSNTLTITWCNLVVNGVCWADVNVTTPGVFAPRPDMYTEFYQWSQSAKAWSPSAPAAGVQISGWNNTITAPAWTSTPCPAGWRLPTQADFVELDKAGGGIGSGYNNVGSTWVEATIPATRGAAVAGRFYGPNHANAALCMLPSPMTECIFLPAGGYRGSNVGTLHGQGSYGYYWASVQESSTNGLYLYFLSNYSSGQVASSNKSYGFTVRCVQ